MKKIASRYIGTLCLLMAPAWSFAQPADFSGDKKTLSPQIPELDCVIEPSAIVDAGSSVPGLIESINVDRSDLITAGEVLAKLESSVESAALKRARAQATTNTSIKLREESLKLGKITEQRNAELMEISAISKQDMEQLQTESRIAELQVKQEKHNKHVAQLEYQRAKAALARLTIRSPIEGVVTERFKAVGEYVEDEPVLRIAQINPLFVEVVVPVDYLGAISAGMQAEVFPGATGLGSHIATVERVDRVADAASGTYGVRLSLQNPDYSIPAGLRCKLAFLAPAEPASDTVEAVAINHPTGDQSHWVRSAESEPTAAPATASTTASEEKNSPIQIPVAAVVEAKPAPAPLAQELTQEMAPELAREMASHSLPPATTAALVNTPLASAENPIQTETMQPVLAEVDLPAMLLQAALATRDSPTRTTGELVSKPAPAKAAAKICYSIGPVATERLAHQLVSQVSEQISQRSKTSLMNSLRDEKSQVTSGYYVLANSGESDEAVGEYLDRLNAANVEDHMLLNRGSHKGRISLGYFHRHASALARVKLMNDQGFEAEVIDRTGTTQKYWLDFSGPDQSELKSSLQEIASAITPDAALHSSNCKSHVAVR